MALVRRRQQITLSVFVDECIGTPVVATIATVIVLSLLSLAVWAMLASTNNDAENNRQQVAQQLDSFGKQAKDDSPVMIAQREKEAQEFIAANNVGVKFGGKRLYDQFDLSGQEINSIKQTAKTGQPAVIDTRRYQYGEYFSDVYLWPGGVLLWLLCASILTAVYAIELDGSVRGRDTLYMADLPWRWIWPWFITLLLGPVGWISMAVSAIRMPARPVAVVPREVVQARTVRQDPRYANAAWGGDDGGTLRGGVVARPDQSIENGKTVLPKLDKYTTAPKTALGVYEKFRSDTSIRIRQKQIGDLGAAIDHSKAKAKKRSDELKALQREVGDLTAQKQALEGAVSEINHPDNPTKITEEFERILSLPGVIAVQVVNDALRIICQASIEYEGKTYDLGDWYFDINPRYERFDAHELRSGLKAGWERGTYPSYGYQGDTFCFGARQREIEDHLRKCQYLEAIALAVECLNSVNEEDKKRIPRAFRPVVTR